MHKIIHIGCGNVALLYAEEPAAGAMIKRDLARHLDGSDYRPFESCNFCESCGHRIRGPKDLAPGGPVLLSYDMSNIADMQKLYGTGVSA